METMLMENFWRDKQSIMVFLAEKIVLLIQFKKVAGDFSPGCDGEVICYQRFFPLVSWVVGTHCTLRYVVAHFLVDPWPLNGLSGSS